MPSILVIDNSNIDYGQTELVKNPIFAMDYIDDKMPEYLVVEVCFSGVTIFELLNELASYNDTRKIRVVIFTKFQNYKSPIFEGVFKRYNIIGVFSKLTEDIEGVMEFIQNDSNQKNRLNTFKN